MSRDAEAVRAELDRILGSECFAHSQRHREFLRYVVEEALAGRGDRIKGYTIAVEVFQRPADFNALNDPYVRVEAGRLRRRLAEYYMNEGANDAVRIEVKKGTYEPEFLAAAPKSPAAQGVEATAAARTPPQRTSMVLGAVTALVALAGIALLSWLGRPARAPEPSAITAGAPVVLVREFQNLGDSAFDFMGMGLTEQVLVLLSQYQPIWGRIQVFRDGDANLAGASVSNLYELTGSVLESAGSVRITARIVNGGTGMQIWSYVLDQSLGDLRAFEVEDRAAADIVNIVREPDGPVADMEAARVIGRPVAELAESECHLLFQNSMRSMSRAEQSRGRECFEKFAAADALAAPGWAALALLRYWEYEDGFDLREARPASLQSAYDAVQRSLDLNGSDVLPHVAFAVINIGRRLPDRAITSTERFLSLNPPPSTRLQGEALRLRLGTADSTAAFEALLPRVYRPAPYAFIGPALFTLGRGDYAAAIDWAERIDAPEYALAQVLWAALAALNGQEQRAGRHVRFLLELHPEFARYGRELVGRWSNDAGVVERLLAGLSRAGLELD